jgi:hypothetical protein
MKKILIQLALVITFAALYQFQVQAADTNTTSDINADGKPGHSPGAGISSNLVATGAWSEPVSDGHGNTLRGRLLVYNKGEPFQVSGDTWRLATIVYLEIQDMAGTNKPPTQIYFDPDKTLHFKLRDGNGDAVHTALPSGGNSPVNADGFWATVPSGGLLRYDANGGLAGSTSLLGSPRTLPLLFHCGGQWIIAADEPNAYFLSVTIPSPPTNSTLKSNFWQGPLEFPAVKVSPLNH